MATYEEIYGKRVEVLGTDPTLTAANEGQVWYNSTSGALKSVLSSAVVVSSTAMPTATRAYMPIGASQDSFIVATGANPGTNYSTNCYEYNGSGWANAPSAGTARDQACRSGGVGTVTAGMISGGSAPGALVANTETYDGSSWTETGNLSDSRGDAEMFGTKTAAALTGGYNAFSPPYWTNATEEFNGSSWTSGTATPLNTSGGCGVGTLTAGMIVGQKEQPSNSYPSGASVTQTRNYDGTSWSLGGTLNMAAPVNVTVGTQAAARKAGGAAPAPASYTNTEEWDNTAWTTGPSLGSVLSNGGGAGTATASVFAGGHYPPGNLATVQEITQSIGTISAAAWSSGDNLNTARYNGAGAGSQTATVVFGGVDAGPSNSNATEIYDGSSWTTSPATLPAATKNLAGFGTSTAAIAAGGQAPGFTDATSSFNGSAWTGGPTLNTARGHLSAAIQGTSTAGLVFGGEAPPGYQTATESFNGSAWTTTPNSLPSGISDGAGAGTQTAALSIAHEASPLGKATYEWNGSSWTASGPTINTRAGNAASGSQTAAITFAGQPAPGNTLTEGYDGTAWSTRPSMATARYGSVGSGTATAGLSSMGYTPSPAAVTNATEEFTGEVETTAAKTLTTS